MPKGKVFTMPALPGMNHHKHNRTGDLRYVEGQRLLVQAIRYLVQTDPRGNLEAVELLSQHFRTKFRITDRPDSLQPQA